MSTPTTTRRDSACDATNPGAATDATGRDTRGRTPQNPCDTSRRDATPEKASRDTRGPAARSDATGRDTRRRTAGSVVALIAAIGLTAMIGVASFVLSFNALRELVIAAGQPAALATLFPLAVDGAILQATIGLVVIAERPGPRGRSQRRFFWTVLIAGSAASIGLNALHALLNHSTGFNGYLAAALAAIAPVGLICAVHGLVILAAPSHPQTNPRRDQQPTTEDPTSQQAAAAEPAAPHTHIAAAAGSPTAAAALGTTTPDVDNAPAPEAAAVPAGPDPAEGTGPANPAADVKTRARDLLDAGYHRDQIATMLGKHRATIYRWLPVTDDEPAPDQLQLVR